MLPGEILNWEISTAKWLVVWGLEPPHSVESQGHKSWAVLFGLREGCRTRLLYSSSGLHRSGPTKPGLSGASVYPSVKWG